MPDTKPKPIPIPDARRPAASQFEVLANGLNIIQTLSLTGFEVRACVNQIPTAVLTLREKGTGRNPTPASSSRHFVPGNRIELRAGTRGSLSTLFNGVVVKLRISAGRDGEPELSVECRHTAFALDRETHARSFTAMRMSEIAEAICSEHAFKLENRMETEIPTPERVVQRWESDWKFLLNCAAVSGFQITFEGETMVLSEPGLTRPVANLHHGRNLLSFDAELDATAQVGSVSASAWNPAIQKPESATSTEPELPHPGNISGQDLAASAGSRYHAISKNSERSKEELQRLSDSALIRSRLRIMTGQAEIHGSAGLQPGQTVQVEGAGDRFNGPVYLSGVTHRLTSGMWITQIAFGLKDTEIDAPVTLKNGVLYGLQTGVVTSTEDPDDDGRVNVRLPMGDTSPDGSWMRIAVPDAGNSRGWHFRPEIGDEVIVGFMDGDPRGGVILGMAHSRKNALPERFRKSPASRGYISRDKLELTFDDENQTIHIATAGGQSVTLSDEPDSLLLADAHGNRIELNIDGITIESTKGLTLKADMDLKIEGMKVNARAISKLKAEGGSGAELSSGATTVVKGSLVKIN